MHWQPMTPQDLPAVSAIAGCVHPDYPENDAVFAERLRLYPEGCLALHDAATIVGYVISHPWHDKQPPALNMLLRTIPSSASSYYLHDIALLPAARCAGAASAAIATLIQHAASRNAANISLVAVNDSASFWLRHGFEVLNEASLKQKLASYGDDARFMFRRMPA
jgi:ribosomal protein S18 acetylase RimI-like enzyme